ncbi:MAG TPA: Na+/H+ antiporter [Mycobacteriales bacterium]|nr:Na+/H+ antiporter [Mycobacteriales bacterium]
MIEHQVAFVLAAVGVVVLGSLVARRLRIPVPVVLVLAGLAYAALPGRNVGLEPDLVLAVIIPPLLYSAAIEASLVDIRASRRPVASLSVGLVLATAFTVGGLLQLIVPGLPFAAALALGAAVAPPDPVAALGVARRAGLPPRLMTLVEGEGLLNDATALTVYQVAVASVAGAGFSLLHASGQFALAALGGIAVGLLIAWLSRQLYRRLDDSLLETVVSLATPFAAYLAAEEVHASGVLAVVVAGLLISHSSPTVISAATRLQALSVWRLVALLLEGLVFLLIGQQVPVVLGGLDDITPGRTVLACVLTLAGVLLVRPLWLYLLVHLPGRMLGENAAALGGRELIALSWAGTRGVITLAAAFALPLTTGDGRPLPGRELMLLCAYLVVLVTLVGQGLTLGPILRLLGLRDDRAGRLRARGEARVAAAEAALRQLDDLSAGADFDADVLERVRQDNERRLHRRKERLRLLDRADVDEADGVGPGLEVAELRRAMIEAERRELLRRRDSGQLRDADLRTLQRELDHEERLLSRSEPS